MRKVFDFVTICVLCWKKSTKSMTREMGVENLKFFVRAPHLKNFKLKSLHNLCHKSCNKSETAWKKYLLWSWRKLTTWIIFRNIFYVFFFVFPKSASFTSPCYDPFWSLRWLIITLNRNIWNHFSYKVKWQIFGEYSERDSESTLRYFKRRLPPR